MGEGRNLDKEWDGPLRDFDSKLDLIYVHPEGPHPEGSELIAWSVYRASAETGWREVSPGVREEVTFCGVGWGWWTSEELWNARANFPRSSP